MVHKLMTLYRGIPGSGKSTLAKSQNQSVFEADQYFEDDEGVYRYDRSKIGEAHTTCFRGVGKAIKARVELIGVSNTFINYHELSPYVMLGESYGYEVRIMTLLVDPEVAAKRCVHDVPLDIIRRMDSHLREEKIPGRVPHHVFG